LTGPGPFPVGEVLAFLGARAVPGIEAWTGERYVRTLDLPHGHGVAIVGATPEPEDAGVTVELRLEDERDEAEAERRVRRLLDVDADTVAVARVLGADPALAPLVAASPTRRVPGSVDPFETTVRAIVGQQVSVAGARTVAGRIVGALGHELRVDGGGLVTRVFPTPGALADADPALFPMPRSRAATIGAVAGLVATGDLHLDAGADRDELRPTLLAVPGIGPWTVDYVLMRGLSDPDVFLPTDLGVRVGLSRLGLDVARAGRWRPWRSYALHHLWALAARPIEPAA